MKIANSLRPETMPGFVYSICKMANTKEMKRDELKRAVTLNVESDDLFNNSFKFSKESGIITEVDGICKCLVQINSDITLDDFLFNIIDNIDWDADTKFNNLMKWFLKQENTFIPYNTSSEITSIIPSYISITSEYILGWRFWMKAFGYLNTMRESYYFSLHHRIKNAFKHKMLLKKNYTAREFQDILCQICPELNFGYEENKILASLSLAFRVLHSSNVIRMTYQKDAHESWYLYLSKTHEINRYSHVEVL